MIEVTILDFRTGNQIIIVIRNFAHIHQNIAHHPLKLFCEFSGQRGMIDELKSCQWVSLILLTITHID